MSDIYFEVYDLGPAHRRDLDDLDLTYVFAWVGYVLSADMHICFAWWDMYDLVLMHITNRISSKKGLEYLIMIGPRC